MSAARDFHRAGIRVTHAVRALSDAIDAWGTAALALEGTGATADDDAQHAVIDECREAMARIVARFPGAVQLLGLDALAEAVAAAEETEMPS